ncbi:hypothetical protein [Streptomyces tubercidicus]|uniref:hypothetical protein n=1 Tax=Streptomyces tubercidicus TaxID=47759 RepID=UPI0036A43912
MAFDGASHARRRRVITFKSSLLMSMRTPKEASGLDGGGQFEMFRDVRRGLVHDAPSDPDAFATCAFGSADDNADGN